MTIDDREKSRRLRYLGWGRPTNPDHGSRRASRVRSAFMTERRFVRIHGGGLVATDEIASIEPVNSYWCSPDAGVYVRMKSGRVVAARCQQAHLGDLLSRLQGADTGQPPGSRAIAYPASSYSDVIEIDGRLYRRLPEVHP